MTRRTDIDAASEAIRKIGGPAAVAGHLEITVQAVTKWTRIPPGRVLDIERLSGVSRHKLRPDIFGASSEVA